MGSRCATATAKTYEGQVDEEDEFHVREEIGAVYVIIFASNYRKLGPDAKLSAEGDGQAIEQLAKQYCSAQSVQSFYARQCNPQNLEYVVASTCNEMEPEDFLVFFFAGHGTQLSNTDGYESDGLDEAMVLMSGDGSGRPMLYRDDKLADLFSGYLPDGARLLIITDCCHSGTMADLDKPCWDGLQAISIAGCLDHEESNDTGSGGLLTHCLCWSLNMLSKEKGSEPYSVAKVFNLMIHNANKVYKNLIYDQHLQMCTTAAIYDPSDIEWPLQPQRVYTPPVRKTAQLLKAGRIDKVANLAAQHVLG